MSAAVPHLQLSKRGMAKRDVEPRTDCRLQPKSAKCLDLSYCDIMHLELSVDVAARSPEPECVSVEKLFVNKKYFLKRLRFPMRYQKGVPEQYERAHAKHRDMERRLPKYEEPDSDSDWEYYAEKVTIKQYRTTHVKLCYNQIHKLTVIERFFDAILMDPTQLTWLDLSFNEIKKIPPYFASLENLAMLYLHSNKVPNIRSVCNISGLKALRKVTLHCNPVCLKPAYRSKVIALLPPVVTHLDFTAITKADKSGAAMWFQSEGKVHFKKWQDFTDPRHFVITFKERRPKKKLVARPGHEDDDDDDFSGDDEEEVAKASDEER